MNANDVNALVTGSDTPGGLFVLVLLLVLVVGILAGLVGWFLKDLRLGLQRELDKHTDELRGLRESIASDMKDIRSKLSDEVRGVRAWAEGDLRELRRRLEEQGRALERRMQDEFDRVWQHIARHEKGLPEKFALREDFLRDTAAIESKLDGKFDTLPCKNGGTCERDAAARA